ncbi:hypothetical protein P8C59_000616 [Phyllachora maydis]|uniref:Large-conductance mechanosensitive channel n=1 Tax=Phyllachora maydis TaxID=1825666 RepID=A0AAD9HWH4_9PEZI|nr:hypothetical protein P8C59_000616 [Phyllachora maydis]
MPRLEEYTDEVENENRLRHGERQVRKLWAGFAEFLLQDNILEVALGLILASMFTAVTTSFVSDIMLPPLSVIFPLNKNLQEKFAVLRPGPNYAREDGYNTLKLAQDDGAVVMAYGAFINRMINFFGVGLSLYVLAGLYQLLSRDPIIKHTVKCKYCRKTISANALRCLNCTSWLDGREDQTAGQERSETGGPGGRAVDRP